MSYFLTTARMGFRPWTPEDLPLAVGLWCDPAVMAHMGGAYTPEAAAARLDVEMARQREYGIQYWPAFLLRADAEGHAAGGHVGCAGLKPWHGRLDVLELGVHIGRGFWSGRFGEEAARAMVGHAFGRPGVTALMAGHGPENTNSQALIQRLGFVYAHEEVWGPLQQMSPFYRLERREWQQR